MAAAVSHYNGTSLRNIAGPHSSRSGSKSSSDTVKLPKDEEEDLISKLPDEIIVSILCLLDTVEQKASTSILARRWRYLWKYSATNLKFELVEKYWEGEKTMRYKEFFRRVHRVIKSLTTTITIDTFDLLFHSNDLRNYSYQHVVDECFNFAFQKRVKRLNLRLPFNYHKVYSLNDSRVMSRIHNQSLALDSLRYLGLFYVDVSGEVIEYILSTSSLLEELSVVEPGRSLVKLTVSGWSLKLKYLEFSCRNYGFKHLDIHDVNLESLKYNGNAKRLTTRNTPRLVRACFPEFWGDGEVSAVNRNFSNLPQLETLWLTPFMWQDLEFPEFPKLRNLKQLELVFDPSIVSCVRFCALLLDASPLLSELKLEFKFLEEWYKEAKVSRLKHPHQSVKKVEIVGFIGCEVDVGVALYLIENIAALEVMTIDTHHPYYALDPVKQQTARELATTRLEPILTTTSPTPMLIFK